MSMKNKCKKNIIAFIILCILIHLNACETNTTNNKPNDNKNKNNTEQLQDINDVEYITDKENDTNTKLESDEVKNTESPNNTHNLDNTQINTNSQANINNITNKNNITNSNNQNSTSESDNLANIRSKAPGWDKVPNYKNSNLSEKEMAKGIVECIISSTMTDFEKAFEIHEWLIFNVDYDHSFQNYYAKNAFVDRKCVCQGYSEAFKLMAEAAGLKANFVSGTARNSEGKTESHAWNQVCISGKWYNVDVTWDDPTYTGKNFNDHSGNRHDYFLISKSQLEKDHNPSKYEDGENPCVTNYDQLSILKKASNSGRYGDVAVVTNPGEANEYVKKYMDNNQTKMMLWIYDNSITINTSQNYLQNFLKNLKYIVSCQTYYPSNTLLKCPIEITPSSEWNSIPIIKNVDEFKSLLDKNGDSGVYSYKVRYEPDNGTPILEASRYGFSVSYYSYNGGNWWLIDVNIN